VLARLWPEQVALNDRDVWLSVRFSDAMRVVAYAPEQEAFVESLRDLLRQGALARAGKRIRGWYYSPMAVQTVTQNEPRIEPVIIEGVIWIHPNRVSGAPCFINTRVPVQNLFDYLEAGHTLEDFLEGFPPITKELSTIIRKRIFLDTAGFKERFVRAS
jgi:uncharacterized protein (DUF433 family)